MLFWTVFLISRSILLAQHADSTSHQIHLKTFVEKDNVALNEEIIYQVELSWQGELDRYTIKDVGDPIVSNLTLRGSGSSNQLITDDQGQPKSIRRVTYYFKAIEMGMAYIDGLTIEYKDNLLKKTETLLAQRISVKIGEPTASMDDEFVPGTIMLWLLLAAFFIAVIYFLVRYMQRRQVDETDEVPITLEQKYLTLLRDTIHLTSGARKEIISELKKLLNSYISEKFSIPGNVDSAIVRDRLAELNIPQDMILKIETMYSKAELASFAGEEIEISELHLFYDSIEHVLETIDKNEQEK